MTHGDAGFQPRLAGLPDPSPATSVRALPGPGVTAARPPSRRRSGHGVAPGIAGRVHRIGRQGPPAGATAAAMRAARRSGPDAFGGAAERGDVAGIGLGRVGRAAAEHRRARDQHIGAGRGAPRGAVAGSTPPSISIWIGRSPIIARSAAILPS